MALAGIPIKFAPSRLTRSGLHEYKDLKSVHLTVEEKMFLCREIGGQTDYLGLTTIVIDAKTGQHFKSQGEVARRYNLSQQTISGWMQCFVNGHVIQEHSGRPPSLDSAAMEEIKTVITERNESKKSVLQNQFPALVKQQVIATMKRRGIHVPSEHAITVDESVVQNAKKELGISFRKPQCLTEARLKAINDTRLVYRVACVCYQLAAGLPAPFKWNCDATTLVVENINNNGLVCYMPGSEHIKKLDSASVTSELSLLMKWVLMCSASGLSSRIVLVINIPTMPPDTFYVSEIEGLGVSGVGGGETGRLYFCQKRTGNAALWQDWFKEVVIPTLRFCREHNKLVGSDGEPLRMFLNTDGEAAILTEAFDRSILDAFQGLKVDYLKNGPSVTSVLQPCDVSPVFRDVRTGLDQVRKKGAITRNDVLAESIRGAIRGLMSEFSEVRMGDRSTKIVKACEDFVYVLHGKYYNCQKLCEGFEKCGQHVYSAQPGEPSVDYELMMRTCLKYKDLPEEDKENLRSHKHEVGAEFLRTGRASTVFLNHTGVITNEDCQDRDDRVLWQQDAVLVTHEDTYARLVKYLQERTRAAAEKERKKGEEKGVETYETVPNEEEITAAHKRKADTMLRGIAKKEARVASQLAETARRAALTPAQSLEEAAERKKAAAAKKVAKEAAEARKAQWALDVASSANPRAAAVHVGNKEDPIELDKNEE
jgi:transposase